MPFVDTTGTSYGGTYTLTASNANAVWGTWTTTGIINDATIATFDTESVWTTWTTTGNVNDAATITDAVWSIWVDGVEQVPQPRPVWKPNAPYNLKAKLQRRRKQRPIREAATALLQSILTDDEWEEWRRYDSVRVVGSGGGVYEVGVGWEGMLFKIGIDGEPEKKLCCHPPTSYPTGDRVATMILALRTDEAAVLRKANAHHFSDADKRRVKARRAHRLRRVA